MMKERRSECRMRFNFEGFSVFEGVLNEVKIRDVTSMGIGLFSVNILKRGLHGLLFARLPSLNGMEQVPISVCWCVENPKGAGGPYQFRVGLKILNKSASQKVADQIGPIPAGSDDDASPEGFRRQTPRNSIKLKRIQIGGKRIFCDAGSVDDRKKVMNENTNQILGPELREEEVLVKGIIVPGDFDARLRVTSLLLSTDHELDLLIERNAKRDELMGHLRELVLVRGFIREDQPGKRTIRISDYQLPDQGAESRRER